MTGYRIALVTAFPPSKNSLNEYGYHLARSFAERDDVSEIIIIADKLNEPARELDLGPKIKVKRVWQFNNNATPTHIQRAVRPLVPDLCLFNLHMASFGDWEIPAALGLAAPLLTKACGFQTGIIAHNLFIGVDLDQTNLKGKPLRQWMVKLGGSIMTNMLLRSDYLTVTLGSYMDTLCVTHPKANVRLVPHGTFDKPQPLDHYQDRPQNIVTMGKFGTYKKLESLIEAFCLLKPVGASTGPQLIIGGTDHPATPGYVDKIQAQYLHRKDIEFLGYVPEEDVPGLFTQARLCVFDYESTTGSSGVLHQAASFGTPPIFPHIGDFVDLCEDEGLTGLHYEPGDAKGMAAAMKAILSDPEMAENIAHNNHTAAHAFPISKVTEFHIGQIEQKESKQLKEDAEARLAPAL